MPSVYDKVKVKEEETDGSLLAWLVLLFWSIWPLSGLYGVYKAFMGGEYLMQKKSNAKMKSIKGE